VNIQVNDVSETRKSLVVTLDAAEVATEQKAVLAEFSQYAQLPGFRPGKVPPAIIAQRYGKQMAEELKQKVVNRAYRGAVEDKKLPILTVVNVEPGEVAAGQGANVSLTVDIRPEFKLPEYQGLPVTEEPTDPSDSEVENVITGLRGERADFKVAERASQKGDFVKLAYAGTIDGKPISEIAPDHQIYGAVPQTWEEVEGEHAGVLPGLGTQLAGLKAGDKKTVAIAFPADFAPVPALAGKNASYDVTVQEVRERVLPPLDETFFKAHQVNDLAGLQAQVRANLKMQKDYQNRAAARRQVTEALAAKVDFPVPQSMVDQEAQQVLRQFIEENMRRGVPEDQFQKDKKQLVEGAQKAAHGRVKLQLLLARIAEEEKLSVTERDLDAYIYREAARANLKPDKLAKELSRDRDQLRSAQQSILFDKAVDFLVSKAKVTPSAPQPA
jgi:trigger factor